MADDLGMSRCSKDAKPHQHSTITTVTPSGRQLVTEGTGSDWEQFKRTLASRVPGLPANVTRSFDITRRGILDHTQRTALRRATRWLYPDIAAEAIDACSSLGEIFDVGGPPEQNQRPRRGTFVGRELRLRPVRPSDVPALYDAALDPSSSFRWRFRGSTPSPEAFESALYAGVLAQFIVESNQGERFGLVTAYNHRPDVRSVNLALQRTLDAAGSGGEMIAGMAFMLDYLFTTFDLRRVYFEIPEYNRYLADGLIGSILHLEAELTEQLWHDGRFWSMLLCTLDRERWNEVADLLFSR